MGVLLSVGATRGKKLFDGIRLTFGYFLDVLEAEPWAEHLVRGADAKGEVGQVPDALEEARALGERLAREVERRLARGEGDGGGEDG